MGRGVSKRNVGIKFYEGGLINKSVNYGKGCFYVYSSATMYILNNILLYYICIIIKYNCIKN